MTAKNLMQLATAHQLQWLFAVVVNNLKVKIVACQLYGYLYCIHRKKSMLYCTKRVVLEISLVPIY